MNKTTTLMLMAAGMTAMPLIAADAPAVAESAPAVAAPAATGATMQQLAKEFAPAALLPADVDLAIVLPSMKAFKLEMDEFPLEGIVLGMAKGSADSYHAASTCQMLCTLPEIVQETAGAWKEKALAPLGEFIAQTAARISQESGDKVASEARKFHLPPVYLIAAPKPGAAEMVGQTLAAYTAMLTMSAQEQEGVEAVSIQGLNGVKLSGAVMANDCIHIDDSDPGYLKDLKEELSKRTFYLLAGMKDGNAAIILCENPEEIYWAPTPEQSVLSAIAAEPWTANEANKPWAFLTLSPETMNRLDNDGDDVAISLLKQVGDLFQTFAEKDNAQAAVFQAAAAGLGAIAGEISTAMAKPVTKPTTLSVWGTEGLVHITLKGDAQGAAFKPGKLRLDSVAKAPQNILYFESTGLDLGYKPDFVKLISAADDVIKGVSASLRPDEKAEIDTCMQQAANLLPELKNAWQGVCTIADSLGGSTAFVVDTTEQISGPNQTTLQPAFCIYTGVANRAKLAEGSVSIGTAIRNLVVQCGQGEDILKALTVESKVTGDASVFSLACPCLPPGVCPNVTFNGDQMAVGTSVEMNEKVIQSATGSADFAGCAFSVNFSELAKLANNLVPAPCTCCAAAPAPAETAAAPAPADKDDEMDDDDDDDDDMDDDDDIMTCSAKSTEEQIRDVLNTVAEYAESLKGTSTIENGVNTVQIDVILKK